MTQQLTTEYVRLDQIKHLPGNPKDHDLGAIMESIHKYGFLDPIGVGEASGNDFDGNGRLDALRQMMVDEKYGKVPPKGILVDEDGMWKVPVVGGIDWLDPAGELAAAIALNQTNALGGWDQELLATALFNLEKLDRLEGTGFDKDDLDAMMRKLGHEESGEGDDPGADLDRADELQEKWKVERGQLWQLGDHLVLCGDCTDAALVDSLMQGDVAQICWTDPPWNVAYGKTDHPSWKKREIENDNLGDEFAPFVAAFIERIAASMDLGGMIYMAMSAQEWPLIDGALRNAKFHWSSTIIWAKDHLVLSRKDYHTQYEPLWYGWYAPEDEPRLYPLEDDRTQSDLWQIDRPTRSEEHPTMKPLELVERSLRNSSRKGDIAIDFFLGSGTTLIGCERLGRRCRGMELMPKYVSVTLERWVGLTGREPLLIGG